MVAGLAFLSGLFSQVAQTSPQQSLFSEVAEAVGLEFIHFNGMSGEFYYPEVVGPGAALFDYDNDGDLDVYLVQGKMLDPKKKPSDAWFPPPADTTVTDRLYRNELVVNEDGSRTLRFRDVTEESGVTDDGYSIGVTTGDVDNDGWIDLYVMNFGHNRLLRNNGDGSFKDITAEAGVGDPRLSVSGAFIDFDRDGFLDLYVVNHVSFSIASHEPCSAVFQDREYCSTKMYTPVPDRLYRNLRNGTFEDVSDSSRIGRVAYPGLGVITSDLNGDGWVDFYVANDGTANQFWVNRRDGTFQDEALMAGVAVNMEGAPEASMGVDAGDFDGDGDEDLFLSHDFEETNTLYVNDGNGWFEDRTLVTGLAAPSKGYTGFGTAWFDFDNNGWLDIFIANGDVRSPKERARRGERFPLDQPNQLFANTGKGRFIDLSQQAGAAFDLSEVSRGAAFGDVDNDGDVDILVSNNSGRTRLMINDIGNHKHWLGLRLVNGVNHGAHAARVVVYRKNAPPIWRRVRSDGSYASANDPRVVIGLGDDPTTTAVRVYWGGGRVEEWSEIAPDRYTILREGTGKVLK
ncbi:MAG: CRTAC1 family protein [Pseudomonadota bacterium]